MDPNQVNAQAPGFEAESWAAAETPQEAASPIKPAPRRLVVRFLGNHASAAAEHRLASTMAQAAEFENLLIQVLAELRRGSDAQAECNIVSSLAGLCSFAALDRAALWCQSPRQADSFILSQHCLPVPAARADNVDSPPALSDPGKDLVEIPLGTESKTCFPWITSQLQQSKRVLFANLEQLPSEAEQDRKALGRLRTHSGVFIPFVIQNEVAGAVSLETLRQEQTWSPELVRRLDIIAELFANATARKFTNEAMQASFLEIKRLQTLLRAESEYLKSETNLSQRHGEIIGHSQAIKKVLHQVEQVAPAECAVLINGETGTGKELIAQEIHRLSRRKEHPMVLVNCAALPSALVESELFGREKGAYTGALTSQVGRFEVANGSTIFLDEVGELSLEVQAKLLRVLQQGEFQRLGSPKTHRVDVRVIAATNRDLAAEVRKGKFREDLYYRLKVFPIDVPPLRARVEDIPPLVFAFIEEFCSRMGKKITKVPCKAMATLQKHAWPGNIRELRNVIEHSVILSSGDMLKLSFVGEPALREVQAITLAEAERQHILRTLESTSWRIKGPHGAAVRLDLQPSTLYSRMQKLGIPHRRQKDEMGNGEEGPGEGH